MMQEDAYPNFMRAYRELRKEGLKFPARDPNERFMIKFEGEPSPAFELADMEQNNTKVVPDQRNENRYQRSSQSREEDPKLLESDVLNLRQGLEALEEILCNAKDIKELQDVRAKENIRKFRAAQKKLLWVVSFQTEKADESSVIELLSIMEYVNEKMDAFKKAAGILKRGGNNNEIIELLKKKKKPVDLLSLDEEFLEIETNVLDRLDKFVYGREPRKNILPESKKEEAKIEPKKQEEVKAEPIRRLEQPDLLIDDYDYSQNPVNIFDLNTLQIGPDTSGNLNFFNKDLVSQPEKQPIQLTDDFEDFFSDLANRRS